MKKSLTIAAIGTAIILSSLCGCATAPTDPVEAAAQKQEMIQNASVILKSAAGGAAMIAIEKKPENRKYVALAVAALDTVLGGADYTPGALVKAMEPVLKEVKDAKVKLAINLVLDLYQLSHKRYALNSNENAKLFITALRDGAKQASQ